MGQYFTQPNTALSMPGGPAMAVGNPQQLAQAASAGLPSADAMLGPDVLKPNQNAPELPFIRRPSVMEAAEAGARPGSGQGNVFSPGLSKGGKLLTLLTSGLQGALAGRAAQEQAAVQSGGRRAGGVGLGFEAGYAQPFQRQEQAAQAQLAQLGAQPVTTDYGTVPAAYLPKFLSPLARLEGTRETNTTRQNIAGENIQSRGDIAAQNIASRQNIAGQNIASRQNIATGNQQTRRDVAQMNLGPMAAVPPELQQQFNLPPQLPLRMLNQAESAANRPLTTVQGEGGPAIANKLTGATQSLGLGAPRMGTVVQVADPNNPGNVTYATAGQAVRGGASSPQSAGTQTAKAAAKAEVPTQIGNKKIAFQTMLDHAALLRTAARALRNGDSRTLAGLANRFDTEFGTPDVTNFDAIANAYNHEVTDVVAKGHMTNSEVAAGGATLPSNANLKTIDKVLDSYEALARSKMKNLNAQEQGAIKNAQPKSGNSKVLVEGRDF